MKKAILLLAAALAVTTGVQALIIDGDGYTRPRVFGEGGFIKIVDPSGISVGMDNFNEPFLYGFDEKQKVLFDGVLYNSHYVFFDPKTLGESDGFRLVGSVLFDSPIAKIIDDRLTQWLTDDIFGLPSVTYLYPALIGLEGGNSAIIDPDNPNQMLWDTTASSPGDWLRVLTIAEVSDSGTTALLGLAGLACLIGFRRRAQVVV